jgi:hypothetical protein
MVGANHVRARIRAAQLVSRPKIGHQPTQQRQRSARPGAGSPIRKCLSGDARQWPRLERLWRRSGLAGREEERVQRRGGLARNACLPEPPRGHAGANYPDGPGPAPAAPGAPGPSASPRPVADQAAWCGCPSSERVETGQPDGDRSPPLWTGSLRVTGSAPSPRPSRDRAWLVLPSAAMRKIRARRTRLCGVR